MHDSSHSTPEPNENDWLIIPNWERFQHYGESRKPIWIKNYTRLLQDPAYLRLSAASRALLHGLWLAFASSSCQLRVKDVRVSLQLRFGYQQLLALNEAGFVYWSASKPLATNKEVEVEVEPPSPPTGENHKSPDAELLTRALDIAADWTGRDSEAFDTALDHLERKHRRQLPVNRRFDLWNEVLRRNR